MRLNDYTVPDTELRVNGSLRIENESLSGQTSSTSRTNNGIKPKVLQVSLLFRFSEPDLLSQLVSVAEATDENGALIVYDIVDKTANAMKIKQVQFSDNFSVREVEGNKAWRVAFSLVEYLSVAEKTEQRLATTETQAQSATGETITTDDSSGENAQQLSSFESFLSKIDKALA